MNQYLTDTEFASKSLIEIIYNEEIGLSNLEREFNKIKKNFDFLYSDFLTAECSEDFDDIQIQHKFVKAARFEKENGIYEKKLEIENLERSIVNKKGSIVVLSMSLLQIAKQGISTVHEGLIKCPNGKCFNSEFLKNIIWQGRNQSIHAEEGKPHKNVRQCFSNLAKFYGEDFDITINLKDNKAKKILDLLKWTNYDNYLIDMKSLLG